MHACDAKGNSALHRACAYAHAAAAGALLEAGASLYAANSDGSGSPETEP